MGHADNHSLIEHEKSLLDQYVDNLQKLEVQAAHFGLMTPTHIQNAIDFEKKRIALSQQRISSLQSQFVTEQLTMSSIKLLIDELGGKLSMFEKNLHELQKSLAIDSLDDLIIDPQNIVKLTKVASIDAGSSSDDRIPFLPLAWNPASSILAVPEWRDINFYSISGKLLHSVQYIEEYDGGTNPIAYISWSPNGRFFVSRDFDGIIQIWGIKSISNTK